jgi:hypothetical protein
VPKTDAATCSICGAIADGPADNSRFREVSPFAKLVGVAGESGVFLDDLTAYSPANFGAAFMSVRNGRREVWLVLLADDLDDDHKADVLAFCLATIADPDADLDESGNTYVGVCRERQPLTKATPATHPGHLAWHILQRCGRATMPFTLDTGLIRMT